MEDEKVEIYDGGEDDSEQIESHEVKEKPKKEKIDKEALRKQKLEEVKNEEKEIINKIKNIEGYEELVSDCYTMMDSYTQMVIDGISYGCMIFGKGATGKTFRTINACSKANIEYAYVNSFATPQQLYIKLYENRDADVIILDDVAGLLKDTKCLSFLKGALWEINKSEERVLSYETTKHMKDEDGEIVPNTFQINARLIIITNNLPRGKPDIEAVLSRINEVEINIPRKTILEIIQQIAKQPYHNLTEEERMEVYEYLKNKTTDATEDLNFRTFFKMLQNRLYVKKHNKGDFWKTLSLNLLHKDESLVIVENLMKDERFATEEERVNEFIRLTEKSRPTYFRLRKQME